MDEENIEYDQEIQYRTPQADGISAMSRIMATTLFIPLHVMRIRFLYPDTWYVGMFRQMVRSKGFGDPFTMLSSTVLRRRSIRNVKLGTYYCRYVSHRKHCALKNLNTLYQGTFLLISRPIVTSVANIESFVQVRDFRKDRRKLREHNVLFGMVKEYRIQLYAFLASILAASLQCWPLDAVQTGIIATTLLHPLDVIKVRLQLYPEAWGVSLMVNMLRAEGFRAPYTGLSAGILRQTTYTTSRLGTYYCLYEYHKSTFGKAPSFPEKIAIGVYAGLVGAIVGCPSEIILVRMMADGPVDPYRRYRGLVDAFIKIFKEEGVGSLWRGSLLTMSRSVVISIAQIGTYSQAREYMTEKRRAKGFILHLYTSMLSSFVTAMATLPLDTFKTRYQVLTAGTHKEVYHKIRQEAGIMGLWRGFTPYYLRLTIHTLITFYLLEVLYDLHRTRH